MFEIMSSRLKISLFLLSLFTIQAVWGQAIFILPSERGSPLSGNFNYRLSRCDSMVMMKISVQLSNNSLQFLNNNGNFTARYRIDGAIYKGDELLENKSIEDSVLVNNFSETNLSEPWQAGTLSFKLPAGKYRLFIILKDRNAKTDAKAEASIKIPDYKKLRLSTPWFFVPHNDSIIISSKIPAIFDTLGIAANAYDIPDGAKCELTISGVRYRAKKYPAKLAFKGKDAIITALFVISEMPGGEYEAKLTLKNRKGKRIASAKTEFTLVQTPLSMYRFHFDELLRQLELIANPSEVNALEDADSTTRDSLWKDFWKKRDPTPSTELNEVKEEFFKRVQYANENFGTPTKRGWETDRGRVYITYGQPNEIERHPFEINTYPYEVWYYYSLGLTFVFVDTFGDGDYQLRETR